MKEVVRIFLPLFGFYLIKNFKLFIFYSQLPPEQIMNIILRNNDAAAIKCLQKVIDKFSWLWYNISTVKERRIKCIKFIVIHLMNQQ
jgi:hypothetical protein